MRKFLLFLILVSLPFAAMPQRAFKPIRASLKAKNYREVVKQVDELRKDSTYRDHTKLCLYKIEAVRGLNDAENMKIYLKRSYDTIAFFSTTLQIIQEAVKLDSLEEVLKQSENRKPKNTRFVCELLRRYYPNLNAAAKFFYVRRKFSEAQVYLKTCLELPHTPIGVRANLSSDRDIINATLYLTSAFSLKNYREVHRYEALSLQDTVVRPAIIEYLMYTAEAEKDTVAYHHWLQVGWDEYSEKKIFFTRLVDFQAARNDYDEVLRMSKKQLSRDSTDVSAMLAQCVATLNLGRIDECISIADDLLRTDSSNVEANYYLGASLVAKAVQIHLPENALSTNYKNAIKQRRSYFKKAEPYLERYRKSTPNLPNRWAPLLYKVYLALNEGAKFEEIEKFL